MSTNHWMVISPTGNSSCIVIPSRKSNQSTSGHSINVHGINDHQIEKSPTKAKEEVSEQQSLCGHEQGHEDQMPFPLHTNAASRPWYQPEDQPADQQEDGNMGWIRPLIP